MPSGFSFMNFLNRSISSRMGVCTILLLQCFIEMHVHGAKSVDPDQTPHYAATDLGLYCLSMPIFVNARPTWINVYGSVK